MALRGSLREFELPDIFQLIANDGKTGQLVLFYKENEAFVIFFRGMIVAAGSSAKNLQTMLFKYLMDLRGYSEKELNELLYLCQGEMRLFTQELASRRYLTKEELTTLARIGIEDLACNLFLWEKGNYRFDSLDSVDDYMIGGMSLASDAVTMEAMRRVDEWKRMRAAILPKMIFAPANGPAPQPNPNSFSIMDPASYIYSLVDGVTPVDALCSNTFFTEYRVYETLMDFWQNNRIIPFKMPHLAAKITPQLKKRVSASPVAIRWLTFIGVHCIALLIAAGGYLCTHALFKNKLHDHRQSIRLLASFNSDVKRRCAALYEEAINGHSMPSSDSAGKPEPAAPSEK